MNLPIRFLHFLLALLLLAISAHAKDIRAGSILDFQPYCFSDESGHPAGFGVDLLEAVAAKMGLRIQITQGPWDQVWNNLVDGRLDVLPIVARAPGREKLVDFCLPHTRTFDAFFVRKGEAELPDLAAATGKEIVVLRSDAAHHELIGRRGAAAAYRRAGTVQRGTPAVRLCGEP
jgi:ABC-type amino acid transport substrate-binding protein